MKRNKKVASFLFSIFSIGILSHCLVGSSAGTNISKVEKVAKDAKKQENTVGNVGNENIGGNGDLGGKSQEVTESKSKGGKGKSDELSGKMVYTKPINASTKLSNTAKILIPTSSSMVPLGLYATYRSLKKGKEVKINENHDLPDDNDDEFEERDKDKESANQDVEIGYFRKIVSGWLLYIILG